MALQVSLSQINKYRRCEREYYEYYVRGLRKRKGSPPLERGTVLHFYLERYYNMLKDGFDRDSAHAIALYDTEAEKGAELQSLADTTRMLGGEEAADELEGMLASCLQFAERYYEIHGKNDAERWEVLLVEKKLHVSIRSDITSLGYADLVTRDRDTGKQFLWEHKSHQRIPSEGYRLRDVQTLLYRAKLRSMNGPRIDAILWNYIRTKEPTEPEVLKGTGKSGPSLTRRKNIDTTWDCYLRTLEANGFDPADYQDMKEVLEGKEAEQWFPRHEQGLISREDVLLHDYVVTAKRIAKMRADWESGKYQPIRNIGYNCDYCDYSKICDAVILSGGEDAVISRYFTTPEQRERMNIPTIEEL